MGTGVVLRIGRTAPSDGHSKALACPEKSPAGRIISRQLLRTQDEYAGLTSKRQEGRRSWSFDSIDFDGCGIGLSTGCQTSMLSIMAKKKSSPTFEPIKPARAHEAVLAQLQCKILEGQLAPGDRLPSERGMMDTFGVSRPTVREALRVAESLGLVAVRHGDPGGPRVLGQPSVGVARVLDGLLSAERTSVAELLEARMVLEGTAARLAAARPAADLGALEQ